MLVVIPATCRSTSPFSSASNPSRKTGKLFRNGERYLLSPNSSSQHAGLNIYTVIQPNYFSMRNLNCVLPSGKLVTSNLFN